MRMLHDRRKSRRFSHSRRLGIPQRLKFFSTGQPPTLAGVRIGIKVLRYQKIDFRKENEGSECKHRL